MLFRSNSTLQYIEWRYKGVTVNIHAYYDSVGNLNKIVIPEYLNLNHNEIMDIIRSFLTMTRARGQPSDRNGFNVIKSYEQNGSCVATERWSYTIPAGKKAIVEFMQCMVDYGSQIAGGTNQCYITCIPNGSIEATIFEVSATGVLDTATAKFNAPTT